MFEYGGLSGLGATLLGAVTRAYDLVMGAGSDLLQAAFNHPTVSLVAVFAVLALGMLGLRR